MSSETVRFRLRPVRDSEMMLLFRWRNEPRVRAVMPFSAELQIESYRVWWPSARIDPERRMMMLEDRGAPVAVVVFLDLRPGCSAKWGFYTAPRAEIGKAESMEAWVACQIASLVYAFDILRLETLRCETRRTHTAMLFLADRVGFETTGEEYLAQDGAPFVIQKLTRAAYRGAALSSAIPGLEIEPDPRDAA